MQELDLGVGQFDEHDCHAVIGLCFGGRDARAECLAIGPRGLFQIGDGNGDVVQFSDHRALRNSIEPRANGPRAANPRIL